MPSTRVADVLAEVFRTYGFDTTTDAHPDGVSRTSYTLDLLAEKAGTDVAVTVVQSDDPVDMDRVDAHARMVHDIGSSYALLATTGQFTDAAIAHGARMGTILWDRNALETVIGRAVLHETIGNVDADLPIATVLAIGHGPAPAETDLPATAPNQTAPGLMEAETMAGMSLLDFDQPATPAPMQSTPTASPLYMMDDDITEQTPEPVTAPPTRAPTPGPAVEEGRGWYLTTRQSAQPTQPATAPPIPSTNGNNRPGLAALAAMGGVSRMPRSRGPDPRVFNPPEGALLAPAIGKERAAQIAKERIYTIDHTQLRYHPKRVYRWSVEAFVEGSVNTTTLAGVRVVDLATRRVEAPKEWNSSRSLREGTFDVPVDHKPVRLEDERARMLVLDSVLEETAREIVVQDHDASFDMIITQKKKVRAHRDDVHLDDEGLQWCPVWCFTGVNGEVEIDALTGAVVGETLKASRGTTMML